MNAAIRDPLNGMWLVTIIARFHLLHRHARPLVAHPGRRLSCAAAPGGGVPGRLAARCCSRCKASISSYGSIPQLLLSGPDHLRCWAAPVGAFILGVYLFVSIRVFGRHGERGVLVAAHPGLQAMAAAAHRRGRRRSRSMRLPSTGCRGAGARRNATASRRSRRTTRARPRRGSSTRLKCAPEQGRARLQRATRDAEPGNRHALAAHVETFDGHHVVAGAEGARIQRDAQWPLESFSRPSITATRPWSTRSIDTLNAP